MGTAARSAPFPWLKPGLFVGAMAPLAALVARGATSTLGADPIAECLNQTGLTALIFLVASLACTPLKTITGWTWPIRVRKELGLLAFFYALLHVSTYVGLDQSFHARAILADVIERKFIFVGFAAFVLLIPLAATSTRAAVRRLGFARWKRIHRLAYLAASLGALHFIWRVKKDVREPVLYAIALAALLVFRAVGYARARLADRELESSGHPMRRIAGLFLIAGTVLACGDSSVARSPVIESSTWLNTAGGQAPPLAGRAVLVEFWTFG